MNELKKILSKIPFKVNKYTIIIVALVVVIFLSLSGRRSFDKTYDAYIEATMDCNAEGVVALLHKSYINNLIEKGEIEDKEDLIQRVHNKLEWYSEHAKSRAGDNKYKYVADFQNTSDINLDGIIPYALQLVCDDNIDSVKAAKQVSIYYNLYYDGDVRTITTDLIHFVKIGQKWYLGEISSYDAFDWE